jgi:hypothetical protein
MPEQPPEQLPPSGADSSIPRRSGSPCPTPNRAFLIIGRSIFPIRLVGHYPVICNSIRLRTSLPAKKKPREPSLPLEHMLLFMVHIEQVEPSLSMCKHNRNAIQQPSHHRSAKGIEQEHHAGPAGKGRVDGIAADDPHRRPRPSRRLPDFKVVLRHLRQQRVQFDPDHPPERQLCCQQHGAPHARACVNKRKPFHRGRRIRSLPPPYKRSKHRRRNPEICRRMPVVRMTRFEKTPRNQPARLHAPLQIERVLRKSLRLRHPRQLYPRPRGPWRRSSAIPAHVVCPLFGRHA